MLNNLSVTAVENSSYGKDFVKPLYNSYCFSNIPQAIKHLFSQSEESLLPDDVFGNLLNEYDNIVLLMVDGFSWRYLEEFKKTSGFLQRMFETGVVSKLTTQYPSTTANQITTIHSGLPVGSHGNYEWFHYDPTLDTLIAPLLFSYAGKKIPGTLSNSGVDPHKLYPPKTLYKDLLAMHVKSNIFLPQEFANSPYNTVLGEGATIVPYVSAETGLKHIADSIASNEHKSYYYFYTNVVDASAHQFGSESKECKAAIEDTLKAIEYSLFKNASMNKKKTLILFTTDHGHSDIDPTKTVYLNKAFPELVPWIAKNKKRELLVPAGTCRNMYLTINQSHLDEAFHYLKAKLENVANVFLVKDLIEQGLFRINPPSKDFMDRVGNLAILATGDTPIWWYEKDKFEVKYKSHHGSLTRNEMEIPFACLPFS